MMKTMTLLFVVEKSFKILNGKCKQEGELEVVQTVLEDEVGVSEHVVACVLRHDYKKGRNVIMKKPLLINKAWN